MTGVRATRRALAAAVLLAALTPGATRAQTIKLATLAPQGSIWDQTIRAMGDRWNKETAGRVQLRIYAGGVAGDESDALRKTRAGQFQGLAITVAGLTEIDPAARATMRRFQRSCHAIRPSGRRYQL